MVARSFEELRGGGGGGGKGGGGLLHKLGCVDPPGALGSRTGVEDEGGGPETRQTDGFRGGRGVFITHQRDKKHF